MKHELSLEWIYIVFSRYNSVKPFYNRIPGALNFSMSQFSF